MILMPALLALHTGDNMKFLAITKTNLDNTIFKYQDFDTLEKAEEYVVSVLGDYPNAFAIQAPAEKFALAYITVDVANKTISYDGDLCLSEKAVRDWEQKMREFAMTRQMENLITKHFNGVAGDDYDQAEYDAKIKLRATKP